MISDNKVLSGGAYTPPILLICFLLSLSLWSWV
jgi:hypothetical protein